MSQDYTDDCYASTHVALTDMQAIENNFAALKSSFSGTSAPSNPVAGMWWLDTTTHILKQRNEANSAWLSVFDMANNKPVITNLSDEITGAMIAAAVKDPVAGTAGLRTLGTGAQQACAGNDARLSDNRTPPDNSVTAAKLLANKYAYLSVPTSSTPLQSAADTERRTYNTNPTKLKEIKIPKGGSLRIVFDLGRTGSWTPYARIYRNGGAVGTQRSNATDNFVTFSEDIAGWTENDLCQLYAWISQGGAASVVKNFRIYASYYEVTLN